MTLSRAQFYLTETQVMDHVEQLQRAVRRVLDDPSYRHNAIRLGEQLRADAESGWAVAELEALALRAAADVS